MIAVVLAVFSMGCAFSPPDCTSGYKRDTNGKCQEIEAVAADTGGLVIEGAFTGRMSIDVSTEVGTLVVADVCEGDLAFDVLDGVLSGVTMCTFGDQIKTLLGDEEFEGKLSGTVDSEGTAAGDFELMLGIFGTLDSPWAGTASDTEIKGSFEGILFVESVGVDVDYSGTFEATP